MTSWARSGIVVGLAWLCFGYGSCGSTFYFTVEDGTVAVDKLSVVEGATLATQYGLATDIEEPIAIEDVWVEHPDMVEVVSSESVDDWTHETTIRGLRPGTTLLFVRYHVTYGKMHPHEEFIPVVVTTTP